MTDIEAIHAEEQKIAKLIKDNGKYGLDFAASLFRSALQEEGTNCHICAKTFIDIMEKRNVPD